MLITNILKDIEALKQIPDEKLQQWIEEYPFSQVLHQEKAMRALKNGDRDQEYWIQKAAHYSTDLNCFAKRVAMYLHHLGFHEPAIEGDIAPIANEALPQDQDLSLPAHTSIQELASDEELASGLAESAVISQENINVADVEYLADEELADDLHEDLDEHERVTSPVIIEDNRLTHSESSKKGAEAVPEGVLAVEDRSAKKLKDFNKWLLTLTPLRDSRSASLNELKESEIEDEVTNTGPSVISIGLAEVLSKQGHYQEAILMYEKLSLKYPEKSDYFAAQIQKLRAL